MLCSHLDFFPHCGPREGKGYATTLIAPHTGDLKKEGVA